MLESRGTAKLRLLFGIVISTMLACLPCRAQQSAGSLAPGIRIGAVEPAPNYGKSSGEQAKQRLVDGREGRRLLGELRQHPDHALALPHLHQPELPQIPLRQARRQQLGGGWRQAGLLAAAGLHALPWLR